jgi:heat shock protein HslJ
MWLRILPLLFLMACANSKKTEMITETKEPNIRLHDIWALTSIDEEKLPGDLSQVPVLEIYVQDKRAVGNDGCNSISGNIKTLTDTELRFGLMMGTKMACPNMAFSSNYNLQLSETRFYTLEKMQLVLYNENRKELLRFKKVD